MVPRIGWQIDPFGASAVTPSVFAMMGFDALVINRVPFQQKVTSRMERWAEREDMETGRKRQSTKEAGTGEKVDACHLLYFHHFLPFSSLSPPTIHSFNHSFLHSFSGLVEGAQGHGVHLAIRSASACSFAFSSFSSSCCFYSRLATDRHQ